MPTAHAMRSLARSAVLIACAAPATKRATKTAVHQTPLRRPPRRSTADCSPTFSGGRNALADLGINVALLTTGGESAKEPQFDLFSQFAEADPAKMPVNWSAAAGILCRAPLTSRLNVSVGFSAGSRSSGTIPRSTPALARPGLAGTRRARVLPSHPASPWLGDPAGFPVHLDPGRRESHGARSGDCRHAAGRVALLGTPASRADACVPLADDGTRRRGGFGPRQRAKPRPNPRWVIRTTI